MFFKKIHPTIRKIGKEFENIAKIDINDLEGQRLSSIIFHHQGFELKVTIVLDVDNLYVPIRSQYGYIMNHCYHYIPRIYHSNNEIKLNSKEKLFLIKKINSFLKKRNELKIKANRDLLNR